VASELNFHPHRPVYVSSTPWIRVLLQMLVVAQLNSPPFMEPEVPYWCSQWLAPLTRGIQSTSSHTLKVGTNRMHFLVVHKGHSSCHYFLFSRGMHIQNNNVKTSWYYEGASESFRTESVTKYMLTTINTR
jgi:hypothetical protein